MSVTLRPYQLDAVERVREAIRGGSRRILVVAPTGAGKTVIAAHIIARAADGGRYVLFLAHRRELIHQCANKLLSAGVPVDRIGVMMANDPRRRPGAQVQVASIDTLRHRAKPRADVVLVDEAHRALAKSYRDVAAAYPNAVHLGLTATPCRADGRGLGDAYDALVLVASPRQLIAEGFLVEPTVFTVPDEHLPDLSRVKTRRGDYDEKGLAEAVDRQTLVGNIVDHWVTRAEGARTVVFAVNVPHSKHIAERFREAGIAAEQLDGTTPAAERDAILGRLERGETRVVSSVGVLCEGWDQPSVKCAVLARPTRSTGLYLQQAGRILRPWEGARAIILDHAGCAVMHGVPQEDRTFSLEDAPKKKGKRGATPRRATTCAACCAVVPPRTAACPQCQAALPIEAAVVPEETDVELVELTTASIDEKRSYWNQLCAEAKARGYKTGWLFKRYREHFGVGPMKSFAIATEDPRDYTPEEKAAYLDELRVRAAARGYKPGYAFVRYKAKFGELPPAAPPIESSTTTTTLEAHSTPSSSELVEWTL